MQVAAEELLKVIEPWAARNGFGVRSVAVAWSGRARFEIETTPEIAFEVYALDEHGNVGVDVEERGERRAYTGPLPDLEKLLDEARDEMGRPRPHGPFDLS